MKPLTTVAECQEAGPRIMSQLVEAGSGLVRFRSLAGLDQALRSALGFGLVQRSDYGPPGGYQLYYRRGLVIVRIKTRGERPDAAFRANLPHLSASLMSERLLDAAAPLADRLGWGNEKAKFNALGQFAAKAFVTPEQFTQAAAKKVPPQWYVIQGGKYNGPGTDAWADRVHFAFPTPFNDAGAANLALSE